MSDLEQQINSNSRRFSGRVTGPLMINRHSTHRPSLHHTSTSMSRKFDRAKKLNTAVLAILEDSATTQHLASKIIRPKPRPMPRFLWKAFLLMVVEPETRANH